MAARVGVAVCGLRFAGYGCFLSGCALVQKKPRGDVSMALPALVESGEVWAFLQFQVE